MRRLLIISLSLFAGVLPGRAQEQNAAEARLRDALKQMTARVQAAEGEAATLKAAQADLDAQNKTLATQLEKLAKDAATDKAAAQKAAAALETKLIDREAELAQTKEALEKWKAGHAKVVELAKKTEAARAALAAKAATLENRIADLVRKNLALFKIGNDVLTRLENFGYGNALTAREPFVGTARVKLENEVQGYKDKLLDPKLKP
jgi:chromosome segregation ATPase